MHFWQCDISSIPASCRCFVFVLDCESQNLNRISQTTLSLVSLRDVIHVFIGTKAQYVKMAPLLQRMDKTGVEYRLIDSGQHADLTVSLRDELGLRDPEVLLGGNCDVVSVSQALLWSLGIAKHFILKPRLRQHIFGGESGVCIVHGDTPTTLLSTLLAWRAGLAVAHVEAGLRTYRWFQPFPEEIIRVIVGRIADVLFAPSATSSRKFTQKWCKGSDNQTRKQHCAGIFASCCQASCRDKTARDVACDNNNAQS